MKYYSAHEIQEIQTTIDQAIIDFVEGHIALQEMSDIVESFDMAELNSYLSVDYLTKLDIVPDRYYWESNDPKKVKTYHGWIRGWYNELKYGRFLLFCYYMYKKRLHEVRSARGEE